MNVLCSANSSGREVPERCGDQPNLALRRFGREQAQRNIRNPRVVSSVESLGDPQLTNVLRMIDRYKYLPDLAAKGVFYNAVPLKVSSGGLEAIPEGLDLLRKGEVSASKLAYTI